MQKIGIFYGSSVGNTRFVAEKLGDIIKDATLKPIEQTTSEDIDAFDFLILGTSTWGVGNMQDDFETFVETLLECDLSNKTIALFGLGDQFTYPDTFCNGMGKLYELIKNKGCHFVGQWPTEEYDFSESLAVVDDQFIGLALDEDNEPDLTDYRLQEWTKKILP